MHRCVPAEPAGAARLFAPVNSLVQQITLCCSAAAVARAGHGAEELYSKCFWDAMGAMDLSKEIAKSLLVPFGQVLGHTWTLPESWDLSLMCLFLRCICSVVI